VNTLSFGLYNGVVQSHYALTSSTIVAKKEGVGMSFIKEPYWCKANERPYEPSSLQKEQECGFWGKVWGFIKLLFTWVD